MTTEPITDAELAELKMIEPQIAQEELDTWARLCDAATDGPWRFNSTELHSRLPNDNYGYPVIEIAGTGKMVYAEADAALIIAARTALPRLLDEHRQLRAENAALRHAADLAIRVLDMPAHERTSVSVPHAVKILREALATQEPRP